MAGAHGAPGGYPLVWHAPDVEDREPDFIPYSDDVGLLVLEAKDWAIDQILSAESHGSQQVQGTV